VGTDFRPGFFYLVDQDLRIRDTELRPRRVDVVANLLEVRMVMQREEIVN